MVFPSLKSRSATRRNCVPPVLHRCEELSTRLHAYTFRQRLGRGAFGQVFLAELNDDSERTHAKAPAVFISGKCKNRKRLVAVKVIRRTKLVKESTRALARAEAENLRRVAESGSLFFSQLRETFCDPHNLYIVTDYLQGGTLRNEMNRRRSMGFKTERTTLIMAQLVEALSQLRALRIVHRDVKPDNILLDACGNVVLADFGLSRWFEAASSDSMHGFQRGGDGGQRLGRGRNSASTSNLRLGIFKLRMRHEKSKMENVSDDASSRYGCDGNVEDETSSTGPYKSCMTDTGCGTLAYAAPEMHRGESYSFPADMYSLGVVFHELLFDRLPPYPPTSLEAITSSDAEWFLRSSRKGAPPKKTDLRALHLLTQLLTLDPSKRVTVTELRTHPFFSGVHWPTLAAHAYILPTHHAPPLPPLKLLFRANIKIDQGIFVDPLVALEDGPESPLEDAYNVHGCFEMRQRPGEPWSGTRTSRVIMNIREGTMKVWDWVRGREGRVRRREWGKDVGDRKGESLKIAVQKAGIALPCSKPGDADTCIRTEVTVVRENVINPRPNTSVVASIGHDSPAPGDYLCALRRVTASTPARLRPSAQGRVPSSSSTTDSRGRNSNLNSGPSSTVAIFSPSLEYGERQLEPEPELDVESEDDSIPRIVIQDSPRLDHARLRPVLSRLSTSPLPSSPEEHLSVSSRSSSSLSSPSSPFPPSQNLAFFLARALEHILPSSSSSSSSFLSSFPPPPQTSLIETGTGSRPRTNSYLSIPSASSCPSLLMSHNTSASASESSSLLPTPERDSSRLPGPSLIHIHTAHCEGGGGSHPPLPISSASGNGSDVVRIPIKAVSQQNVDGLPPQSSRIMTRRRVSSDL